MSVESATALVAWLVVAGVLGGLAFIAYVVIGIAVEAVLGVRDWARARRAVAS